MGNGRALSAVVVTPVETTASATPSLLGRVLEHWKKAAHAIGVVQTRLMMFAIYLGIVLPTGILMRLFRDPLHLRRPKQGNWTPVHQEKPSLETARRQF